MYYRKFNIVTNVNSFYLHNKDVSIWRNNLLYINDEIIYKGEINQVYYFEHSVLIVTNSFKMSLFINPSLDLSIEFNNINNLTCFINETQFIFSNWEENYTYLTLNKYDVNSKKIIWSTKNYFTPSFCEKHKIFGFNDDNIIKINHETLRLIWEFPLSKIGQWNDQEGKAHDYEVQQFVGAFNYLLWIFLKRGLFIALDINTGMLKHKFDGVHASNKEGKVDEYLGEKEIYQFFFRTKYILDQDRGRIIGFHADRYYEIDLTMDNPIPRLYGMLDQFQKLGVSKGDIGYTPVLHDDKLYFLMMEQGRFGVIDTNSKKIVYVSDPINMNPEKGRWAELKELQVSNDKVYILSSDGVLHVYQKVGNEG